MNNQPNGGPAFPKAGLDPWGAAKSVETGMTLRDYFAAKAMQGMVAAGGTVDLDGEYPFQKRAKTAYLIADAMIAARGEGQ